MKVKAKEFPRIGLLRLPAAAYFLRSRSRLSHGLRHSRSKEFISMLVIFIPFPIVWPFGLAEVRGWRCAFLVHGVGVVKARQSL